MKIIGLVLIAAVMSTQAVAASYWYENGGYRVEMPPAVYDHKPTVPVVEIRKSFYDVTDVCEPLGDKDIGCAIPLSDPAAYPLALRLLANRSLTANDRANIHSAMSDAGQPCIIIIPESDGFGVTSSFQEHLRRHETAHCNGWRH